MKFKIALVIGLLFATMAMGQKPSQKSLQQKAKTNAQKAKSVKSKLKKTRRQIGYVMTDIKKADEQLETTRSKLEQTETNLIGAKRQQRVTAEMLKAAEASLANKKKMAAQRMRSLYLKGEGNVVRALFSAEAFSTHADDIYVIRRIAENDRNILIDLKEAREEVAKQKRDQDSIVKRIGSLMNSQLAQKKELGQRMATKKGYLGELRDVESDLRDELDALEKESNAIEAELRRYYSTNKNTPIYRGRFQQPVNGRITSGFGYRTHPILKRRKLHTGVDIHGTTGTPIRAAGDGRVIFSGYRGGYGNCIMIDHGAGVTTLYGHCSRLFVGSGKSVKRGDKIAAVGSTGFSTGPHLHWEVRINGKPVNPLGR